MADRSMLVLVFSRDRALQLDAMLSSFLGQAMDPDCAAITILYRTSTARHLSQYEELAREYRPQVNFVVETTFRSQVLGLLRATSRADALQPGMTNVKFPWHRRKRQVEDAAEQRNQVLFVVDDAVFVRPFRLTTAMDALDRSPDALGFSFRLGRNTHSSYVLSREQAPPSFESQSPGVLKFRWTDADADFAYPLELSSSLYRSSRMASLLARLRFADPNTLESQMSLAARRFERDAPFLLCWETSAAFSVPINRVQAVYQNRAGERQDYSVENMANMFGRGWRIDVAALDGFVPAACHQEIELRFKEKDARHAI
jgi:hypothetical protein